MNGDVDDLTTKVEDGLALMRDAKLDRVREGGLDANVDPQVVVWRGGAAIAVAVMSGHDVSSHRVRVFTDMVVRGLRADVAVLTYEGWVHKGKGEDPSSTLDDLVNPDTGKPWRTGEMTSYMNRHGRDGRLDEGFIGHAVSLLGDVHGVQRFTPRVGAFGATVAYDAPRLDLDGVEGDMVDAVRRSLRAVPSTAAMIAEHARATGMIDHPVEVDAITDATIVKKVVGEQWGTVGLIGRADDEVRLRTLTRVLGRPPATDLDSAWRWS